jgi:hypothetical protein
MVVMNGMIVVKTLRITRSIEKMRIIIQYKKMKAMEDLMKNIGAPK